MTVMALVLAHAREHNCDALEGLCVYDSSDEVVGWIGQAMDGAGHPCEHMGMGDEGYTSCWSSSEISRLRAENAKLRWLVGRWYPHMRRRVGVDALKQWGQTGVVKELGIEVEE